MQIFEKYGHNIVTQPFIELGTYLTLYYLFDVHHVATWNNSKNDGTIFDNDKVASIIESNNKADEWLDDPKYREELE